MLLRQGVVDGPACYVHGCVAGVVELHPLGGIFGLGRREIFVDDDARVSAAGGRLSPGFGNFGESGIEREMREIGPFR